MTNFLAPYGDPDTIKQLAVRLQTFMVGGQRIQPNDALSLAQVALMHGLDPFNGEVWFIPGSGVFVGVKGLRKAARRQSPYHIEFKRFAQDDVDEWNLQTGDIGRICEIYRMDFWQAMGKAARPIVGYAICRRSDKTRMEHVPCAMKRAESDALKRAFDLPFGVADESGEVIDTNTMTEFVGIDDEPATPQLISSATAKVESTDGNSEQVSLPIDIQPNVTNANELLSAINAMTGEHYKNVFQVKAALGITAWPAPSATETWQKYLSTLVDRVNAEKQIA